MIHVVDLDGAFSEADSPNRAVVRKNRLTRWMFRLNLAVESGRLEDVQVLVVMKGLRALFWEPSRRNHPIL